MWSLTLGEARNSCPLTAAILLPFECGVDLVVLAPCVGTAFPELEDLWAGLRSIGTTPLSSSSIIRGGGGGGGAGGGGGTSVIYSRAISELMSMIWNPRPGCSASRSKERCSSPTVCAFSGRNDTFRPHSHLSLRVWQPSQVGLVSEHLRLFRRQLRQPFLLRFLPVEGSLPGAVSGASGLLSLSFSEFEVMFDDGAVSPVSSMVRTMADRGERCEQSGAETLLPRSTSQRLHACSAGVRKPAQYKCFFMCRSEAATRWVAGM